MGSLEMKKQLHLKIFGRVQGVFFRAQACEKARELGLTGWVRNTSDGAVSAVAQGEEAALQEFLAWCKKGPPRAKVAKIKIKWEEPVEKFQNFAPKAL